MKPILLDTGFIVALLDRNERRHKRCAAILEDIERPLVTCEAVISESCYLLRDLPGAPQVVLENVAEGAFLLPFQLSQSASAVRTIMRKYADLPIDFADACLVHLAEQLQTGDILTLDSDFEFYRWNRTRPFQLQIDLN